jgi:hypothetical protein
MNKREHSISSSQDSLKANLFDRWQGYQMETTVANFDLMHTVDEITPELGRGPRIYTVSKSYHQFNFYKITEHFV